MLMASVIGAALIVLWLGLVYLTNRSFAAVMTAPIRIIEVSGGGGGTPDGEVGSTERVDVSGADAAAFASNNELQPADFEEPSVQTTPSAMVDTMMEASDQVADLAEPMERGSPVASGRRASRKGTGGPGYGMGSGDGGVPAEERWSILYNRGQTLDEYARQLDGLGIEMATIINGQMHYASGFSQAAPRVRISSGAGDKRLYFLWQGGERMASDIALLAKAGINVAQNGAIFQFFSPEAERQLAELEVRYRGLSAAEIRSTRFTVVARGRGYAFQVIDQQALQ
jgi:hypothetical protein